MEDAYLRKERIPKKFAAEDVLKTFGWPSSTHQKIVDKKYNAGFRKVAPKADTVLEAPADFYFPKVNPKQLQELEAGLLSLQKNSSVAFTFAKAFRMTNSRGAKVEKALKNYQHYMKIADTLATRCEKDLKACGVQSETLKYSSGQAKIWLEEYRKLQKVHLGMASFEASWNDRAAKYQEEVKKLNLKIMKSILLLVKIKAVMP